MRLNALVLDMAVLGTGSWEYLERICARLPGLAVIVCTEATTSLPCWRRTARITSARL